MKRQTFVFTVGLMILCGGSNLSADNSCPECGPDCHQQDGAPYGPSVSTQPDTTQPGQNQVRVKMCVGTNADGSHYTGTETDFGFTTITTSYLSNSFDRSCSTDNPQCPCKDDGKTYTCKHPYTTQSSSVTWNNGPCDKD